ncbi:MAG: hypothetical protein Q9160_000770 [Pyrenula sp. 1 TL-2023]
MDLNDHIAHTLWMSFHNIELQKQHVARWKTEMKEAEGKVMKLIPEDDFIRSRVVRALQTAIFLQHKIMADYTDAARQYFTEYGSGIPNANNEALKLVVRAGFCSTRVTLQQKWAKEKQDQAREACWSKIKEREHLEIKATLREDWDGLWKLDMGNTLDLNSSGVPEIFEGIPGEGTASFRTQCPRCRDRRSTT